MVLLASGTLAVAPYVKFLSSVAAFNVALPVALSLSILSILVLALSCKIISNNENKDLRDKNVELEAKVKGQLEHKEEMLSLEHQELRDENVRLNERVDSLMEELSQPQKEIDSLKRQLDELKYEEILALLLKERITELETCLEEKRKKVGKLVVQLRKKGETSSLQPELKSAKEKEEEILLIKELSELTRKMHQLTAYLEQKEKRCKELEEEETKNLDRIGELKKLNEKLRNNNSQLKSSKKELGDEYNELRIYNSDLERKVKRLQAVIGQEDKQSHSISSDISSEHLSELEGIGENESVNKQFPKPKPPYISTPIRPPYKKLNDASCDSGYTSRCSTPINS
ncbi:hypothetical protein [Wolbachia endosymbiont (group A) of Cydia strobilella]|uniref:coiled-coil domain-containing protein n=1 Tax=Wolbachia endosymbiont (group A) of Cydia strobilella TaxID=3066170 RepID=UPI003133035C